MNIASLKKIIEPLPDSMDIFIAERKTEFTYGLVNSAEVKEIKFKEEPNGKTLAADKALVLDEE